MDERNAVARLGRGDIGGLEPLVVQYQVRALRAAFLVTRDRSTAENVVAAAFLKAYKRIGSFDVRRPFGSWFRHIVVNDATRAVASRDRDVSLEGESGHGNNLEDVIADHGPTLEELAEQADAQFAIGGALARLSPKQREAIVLHYYLELTEAEVAERQGNTVGSVKRHLHDGRQRLHSILRFWKTGGPTEQTGPPEDVVEPPRELRKES